MGLLCSYTVVVCQKLIVAPFPSFPVLDPPLCSEPKSCVYILIFDAQNTDFNASCGKLLLLLRFYGHSMRQMAPDFEKYLVCQTNQYFSLLTIFRCH